MSFVKFDATSPLAEYALQAPPTPRPAPALERRWLALIVFARHCLPPTIIGRLLNEANLHRDCTRTVEHKLIRLALSDYGNIIRGLSSEQVLRARLTICLGVTEFIELESFKQQVHSIEHAVILDQVRCLSWEPTHFVRCSGQPYFIFDGQK